VECVDPFLVWGAYCPLPGMQVCSLEGHFAPVSAVALSPDGKRVVTGAYDNLVKVWNVETGAEVRMHPTVRRALGLAHTPYRRALGPSQARRHWRVRQPR